MPQAPNKLRKKFKGMDDQARRVLLVSGKYTIDTNGYIHPKVKGDTITKREGEAIDYLVQEWDYGYNLTPEPPVKDAKWFENEAEKWLKQAEKATAGGVYHNPTAHEQAIEFTKLAGTFFIAAQLARLAEKE